MYDHVSQGLSFIVRTRLIAVIFVAAGSLLHADDTTVSPDGFKTVNVRAGDGKSVPFRVKEEKDPFRNVSSTDTSGKYDPERIFSTTSSMANKTFTSQAASIKSDSEFNDHDRNTFVTKPYDFGGSSNSENSASNFKTRVFPTSSAYVNAAAGYDKTFPTSSADLGQYKTALLGSSTDSADQNRTAVLGGSDHPENLTSNSMANKQYLGPGAQHVPAGIVIKDDVVLSRMSGLPDRPLSIDEVRNLINHGVEPDTSAKPDAPSKPLNDPDYQPEPLRDTPSPGAADGKDDPVPSPGTMALPATQAPENSEPLPQR